MYKMKLTIKTQFSLAEVLDCYSYLAKDSRERGLIPGARETLCHGEVSCLTQKRNIQVKQQARGTRSPSLPMPPPSCSLPLGTAFLPVYLALASVALCLKF